ncbi:MAG: DUF4080 domain-containing protein [Helicobacteraceae bacterium]|nr:DUF4080 domain-containing protein [Helicobacteraceae bacterium]
MILTTLNARFTHSAIGLRYLYANLHELQQNSQILEFNINDNVNDIAEKLLEKKPKIIGIGVYIWNALQVAELVEIIKMISPDTVIVLGGPEVSYEPFRVNFDKADFIVQGEGETQFYELCKNILEEKEIEQRVLKAKLQDITSLKLPYEFYNDQDIQHRYIYVEASRGCPFKCEFCLSSIDEKVRYFDLDLILEEYEKLWQKGVRAFKFIDRTFNLNMRYAIAILDFFLSKDEEYFLHFEVIPDSFPSTIKEKLKLFKPASLQLEIGIQTLNEDVAHKINRPLNMAKIEQNIKFLEEHTNAHMHLDLIIGLPSESIESFGANLNKLVSMSSCEIQLGVLKKLSGTSLSRHDIEYEMKYSSLPPYEILQNSQISYLQMQKLKRFTRFWDLLYNSGNFKNSIKLLWANKDIYRGFYNFSEWIYIQTDSTWKISLDRLAELLYNYLTEELSSDHVSSAKTIFDDIMKHGGRKVPKFLKPFRFEHENHATANKKLLKRQSARAE